MQFDVKKTMGAAVAGSLAVAAVVAAVGFGVPSAVQAQTATPPATAAPSTSPQSGQNQTAQGKTHAAYLAEALGISVADLQAAEVKARNAAIDAAVAAGNITQSQADALKNGTGRLRLNLNISAADREKMLADALNTTVEKLQAAEQAAEKAALAQAVADGRLTQAQADLAIARQALQRYMADKGFASVLQAAVADGALTQAQADAILSQAQEGRGGLGFFEFGGPGGFGNFEGRGAFPGLGGFGGLRGGPGGPGGLRDGRGGATPTTPNATATPNA